MLASFALTEPLWNVLYNGSKNFAFSPCPSISDNVNLSCTTMTGGSSGIGYCACGMQDGNGQRSFNAPLYPVWAAWTKADILCQWWVPKPCACGIKSLDLREGGRWIYCMAGPEGDRHWCYFDYETIRPKTLFSGNDPFCDENGVANDNKPKVGWEAHFSEGNGSTLVRMLLHFGSPEEIEQMIRMGFMEGFTLGLQQLDELLSEQKM